MTLAAEMKQEQSLVHVNSENILLTSSCSTLRSSESVMRLVGRLGSMNRMDSVESVVEAPAAETEVTDPGHVLRRLNFGSGGHADDGSDSHVKRYEFAIETSVGPSIFHRTKASLLLLVGVIHNMVSSLEEESWQLR